MEKRRRLKLRQIKKIVKAWLDDGLTDAEVLRRLNDYDNGSREQQKLFIDTYFP